MKAHLAKVSLALLSATFLLGCQDQGTGVVGPDGLPPQFRVNCGVKPNHPQCGGAGGSGNSEPFELDLAGGMTITGFAVDGNSSIFPLQKHFAEDIVLDFGVYVIADCEILRGTDGVHNAPTIEPVYADRLLLELRGATAQTGSFGMDIDLTGLAPDGVARSGGRRLNINYDNEFGNTTLLNLHPGGGGTVRWVSSIGSVDVFELAGPVTLAIQGVTGGHGKKSTRKIRCGGAGDNVVRATVTRLAA